MDRDLIIRQDDAMLFISVRSATVENVPKVLRVVEDIKRLRHKAGTPLSCDLAVRYSAPCRDG